VSAYHVTWEIDVEAGSAIDAAREAWRHMRAPDSIANVFQVIDESGGTWDVDLSEVDSAPCLPAGTDGWEATHRWEAGFMIVDPTDVVIVAAMRSDVACSECDATYLAMAGS
jgi:arginine/lysine/ornithine decarboxylase